MNDSNETDKKASDRKDYEAIRCPKCNRKMIQLYKQYICYNENCGYRIDICK